MFEKPARRIRKRRTTPKTGSPVMFPETMGRPRMLAVS
jgi:hypothetical protein